VEWSSTCAGSWQTSVSGGSTRRPALAQEGLRYSDSETTGCHFFGAIDPV
jgi:hypothetical protein